MVINVMTLKKFYIQKYRKIKNESLGPFFLFLSTKNLVDVLPGHFMRTLLTHIILSILIPYLQDIGSSLKGGP